MLLNFKKQQQYNNNNKLEGADNNKKWEPQNIYLIIKEYFIYERKMSFKRVCNTIINYLSQNFPMKIC